MLFREEHTKQLSNLNRPHNEEPRRFDERLSKGEQEIQQDHIHTKVNGSKKRGKIKIYFDND